MLDFTRLLLLRELEVRGSLAAVARVRGISTSAVSQQLRKLESEAGNRLLEHRGRSLVLTQAGLRLVRRADDVLSLLEAAETELDTGRELVRGTVRMAGFATFASRYLPALVERLHADHPDVELIYHQVEPDQAQEEVAGRRSDMAIVDEFPHIPKPVDRNLRRTFLQRDEIIPCLPAGADPDMSTDALSRLHWVTEPEGTEACAWVKRVCRKLGFEPKIRYQSADLTVHRSLVSSGTAAGFLPRMLLEPGETDFGVPRLHLRGRVEEAESMWRDLQAVTRNGASTPGAVRAVIDALVAIMSPGYKPSS